MQSHATEQTLDNEQDILDIYGPCHENTCLQGLPRSLISAFVIHLLESIISRLATSEISILQLVSVAEEASCLNLTLLETRRQGFLTTRPIYIYWEQQPPIKLKQVVAKVC